MNPDNMDSSYSKLPFSGGKPMGHRTGSPGGATAPDLPGEQEEKTVNERWIYLRLALTMVFWGGTFVAGRLLAAEVQPLTAAAGRFTTAALILLVFINWRLGGLPRLTARQWLGMTLLGCTGVFLYNLFFFTGLKSVEAGRGAMIIAANPVVTTVLAILLFKERFSASRVLGIVVSVSGALVVVSHGSLTGLVSGQIGSGELCMVGCVLSWSAYALIGKKLLGSVSPLLAVTLSCTIGAGLLSLAALLHDGITGAFSLSAGSFLAILYLAVFGTVLGFIWFYEGVKHLGAGRASLFVNLVPVSGVIFGIVLLGERPDLSLFIGGFMVLSGLLLINRR